MFKIIENDLENLMLYKDSNKKCLRALVLFTCIKWRKEYHFLLPTPKNLEKIQLFNEQFKEINYVNEVNNKSKNNLFLVPEISKLISSNVNTSEIVDFLTSNFIIVRIDEGYKIYEDTLNVSKQLAGIRRPIMRKAMLTNEKTKQRKSNIRIDFIDFISNNFGKNIEVVQLFHIEENDSFYLRFYLDLNLTHDEGELLFDLKPSNEKVIKKMIRATRKEARKILSEHEIISQHKHSFTRNPIVYLTHAPLDPLDREAISEKYKLDYSVILESVPKLSFTVESKFIDYNCLIENLHKYIVS